MLGPARPVLVVPGRLGYLMNVGIPKSERKTDGSVRTVNTGETTLCFLKALCR